MPEQQHDNLLPHLSPATLHPSVSHQPFKKWFHIKRKMPGFRIHKSGPGKSQIITFLHPPSPQQSTCCGECWASSQHQSLEKQLLLPLHPLSPVTWITLPPYYGHHLRHAWLLPVPPDSRGIGQPAHTLPCAQQTKAQGTSVLKKPPHGFIRLMPPVSKQM